MRRSMRYSIRAFGWLLLGMGAVLGMVGLLALAGLLAVQIDAFGMALETHAERIAWTGAWALAAVVGLGLLRVSRLARTGRRGTDP